MPKRIIHTDDLPAWAVRKEKLPQPLLAHLREEVYRSPDGKRMLSIEDVIIRQHFEAMLTGNAKATAWLLRMIIKESAAELETCSKRPRVTIEGVPYFQPLAPVLALLGLITVHEPAAESGEPERIEFLPRFLDTLEENYPSERLALVKAWLDSGGHQNPRVRDRDRHD